MNKKTTLTKIMDLIKIEKKEVKLENAEVKLVRWTLQSGVVVEADAFERGQDIFIISSEGDRIPLPVGSYDVADERKTIVVEQEGIIESVSDTETSEHEDDEDSKDKDKDEEEEKMSEEKFVTQEELNASMEAIKELISARESQLSRERAKITDKHKLEIEDLKKAMLLFKNDVESSTHVKRISNSPEPKKPKSNFTTGYTGMSSSERINNKLLNK